MDVSTCVWEAESIEMLDHYLRDKVGNAGKESYYQINEVNGIGLIFLVFFPYTIRTNYTNSLVTGLYSLT
jgi:hypothetical protein